MLAVGLANGLLNIYDIRNQEKAVSLEGPKSIPVHEIKFSNKGFHMAATWEGHDICRVYSMHKQNQFVDVVMGGSPVQSIGFDYYGQYLAVGSLGEIQIFYYRDFAAPLATICEPATSLIFETNTANLIAVEGKQIKFIAPAK